MLLKCLFGIIACTLPVATADFAVNSFSDGISDALLPRQFPGGVSLTDFTPCGLSCIQITAPQVNCSLFDTKCQCESADIEDLTASCLLANCTMEDAYLTSKASAKICNKPYETRGPTARAGAITMATISRIAILLRLASRLWLHRRLYSDDYVLIAALITDNVYFYFGFKLKLAGLGEHFWTIDYAEIPGIFIKLYISCIAYVIANGLVKISLLALYLRIFPNYVLRGFHLACWLTIVFVTCSATAFTFATIFQCKPVAFAWNKDIKGQCINYNATAWAHAGVNILQDLIIISLPIREVRKLQMDTKKKIGLIFIFGLGGFACVISFVRLYTLTTFGLTKDPTWDNLLPTVWSSAETCVALICTSLPAIWAGLKRAFPGFFHATTPTPVRASPGQPSDEKKQSGGSDPSPKDVEPGSPRPSKKKPKSFFNIDSMFSSKNDSFFTQTNRSDDSTLNVNYVMDDGMIRIPVRPNEKAFELEDDRRTKKEKKSKSKGGTVLTRMSDWRD